MKNKLCVLCLLGMLFLSLSAYCQDTNYAYPKEEHESIYLSAHMHEGSIVFVLTDTGKAFDPTAAPDADVSLSADERPIGGLGIFLIRQIMNEVKYERIEGKNVLALEKKIQ